MRQQLRMLDELEHVAVMLARDDEDVHGSLRGLVAEGDHLIVLMDPLRGDLSGHDPAEDAVRVGRRGGSVSHSGESTGASLRTSHLGVREGYEKF
ncbi:hypothetical protein GCM10009591_19050 [Brachybacterium tyrofermentans]